LVSRLNSSGLQKFGWLYFISGLGTAFNPSNMDYLQAAIDDIHRGLSTNNLLLMKMEK
jgi:hypothetical protein